MTDSYLAEPEGAADRVPGVPLDRVRQAASALAHLHERPCLLFVTTEIRRRHVTHLRTALGPSAGPGLDIVVTGPGGNLDAAYLVARELRRRFERVSIYVPLLAKSAATLICLGGDELVLGELGE